MISKKYCELFCKATEIYSRKILKGVLKTCLVVFSKNIEKFSAIILKGLLQNTNAWSEKTLRRLLQKY